MLKIFGSTEVLHSEAGIIKAIGEDGCDAQSLFVSSTEILFDIQGTFKAGKSMKEYGMEEVGRDLGRIFLQ
jgi:hypothetical protein